MAIRGISGPPVEGDEFYGRKKALERALKTLLKQDVLLLGARRIGKTSFARALMKLLAARGWQAVEINVAACKDEHEFLQLFINKLKPLAQRKWGVANDIFHPIKTIIKRINSAHIGFAGAKVGVGLAASTADWKKVGDEFLLILQQFEQPCMIYVDELPIFLYKIIREDKQNGIERVRIILNWLRNDVRGNTQQQNVRWLFTGSVGLDTLVQQHAMADTINTLKFEVLEPYSKEEAEGLLYELAQGNEIELTNEVCKQMLAAIKWLQPYYLQQIFHYYANQPLTVADALQTMINEHHDNDFHHWQTRLEDQIGKDRAQLCCTMLTLTAKTENGVQGEQLFAVLQEKLSNLSDDEVESEFHNLRQILIRDAYWFRDAESNLYHFCLEPLRLWWARSNQL